MTNYFELDEFLRSNTAKEKHIQNTPGKFEIIDNLRELRDTILNPLREDWGSGIIVSSGFRCEELNKVVGGSKTSVHPFGLAVDIQPANGELEDFIKFCTKWFQSHPEIGFDQVIKERSGYKRWVHIGLRNRKGEQRRMLFDITA